MFHALISAGRERKREREEGRRPLLDSPLTLRLLVLMMRPRLQRGPMHRGSTSILYMHLDAYKWDDIEKRGNKKPAHFDTT